MGQLALRGHPPEVPIIPTFEEILALPDDGIDRELIRGRLKERPSVLMQDRWHGEANALTGSSLLEWLETLPGPKGRIVSGRCPFRLCRNPETALEIDVAYVSAEIVAATPEDCPFFEGPPVLAVEILSPWDTREDIDDKIAVYLETGVKLVWIVNPRFQTVTIYQPGAEPRMLNADDVLTAEPYLPGFRVPVAALFGFK